MFVEKEIEKHEGRLRVCKDLDFSKKRNRNSILLPIFDDEKEKRYAERDSGRDEKDQGSGVASEGFFQR